MIRTVIAAAAALVALATPALAQKADYRDLAEAGIKTGGVKMIVIDTPKGKFRVWTKRVGNNPTLKVLLLHGGPGATHEAFEVFDSFLPKEGVEYYYYDQLGSGNSDHPEGDDSLWTLPRFVEEVEQVRTALGLDRHNFCLLGQSWGGMLAMEYALKYQQNLKCLVISNMMASIPAYNDYANKVLMPAMDQKALAEVKALEAAGKTEDPRYMELLVPMHYQQHFLRLPPEQWPEPVMRTFSHINQHIYVLMQGPSELGAGGTLVDWDRFADLSKIAVPTLVYGAKYDTMDPAYMKKMADRIPHSTYVYLPEGSHMAMYDDQQRYFAGLTAFLTKLE